MDRIGRYTVERRLGSGAFALVWLGHDEVLDAPVAIKVLAENWAHQLDLRARFVEEARVLRRADSDRVVRVFDIGDLPDGRPYFVMTYADRGTLEERLAGGAPLPVAQALRVAEQVARGVAVVHGLGVIHRDLKPSNVLFRSTVDGRERLLIADLGLSKALAHASGFTVAAGSPGYMAPEQQIVGGGIDVRVDVYGIGAIAYRLLTGVVPQAGEVGLKPPSALREGLPPGTDSVLARALEIDRERRWPSARSLADALAELASRVPVEAAEVEEDDEPTVADAIALPAPEAPAAPAAGDPDADSSDADGADAGGADTGGTDAGGADAEGADGEDTGAGAAGADNPAEVRAAARTTAGRPAADAPADAPATGVPVAGAAATGGDPGDPEGAEGAEGVDEDRHDRTLMIPRSAVLANLAAYQNDQPADRDQPAAITGRPTDPRAAAVPSRHSGWLPHQLTSGHPSGEIPPLPARRTRRWPWLTALVAVIGVAAGVAAVMLTQEKTTMTVRDESGAITVSVPLSWGKKARIEGWSPKDAGFGTETNAAGLEVSSNLDDWRKPSSQTPGVFVGISRDATLVERVGRLQHAPCKKEAPEPYSGGGLTGTIYRHICQGAASFAEVGLAGSGGLRVYIQIKQPTGEDHTTDILDSLRVTR